MQIREAILKAADHIERNPHLYAFMPNGKPDCDTPGCMLGWIGVFMGINAKNEAWTEAAAKSIGTTLSIFIDRGIPSLVGNYRYQGSAAEAAVAMRLYADAYHPAQGIPDSVRNIFTMTTEQLREELAA